MMIMSQAYLGSEIPRILLSNGTSTYNGVLGSYCWNNICVTKINPSVGPNTYEIISVQKDSTINFQVVGFDAPEKLHITIFLSNDRNIVLDTEISNRLNLDIPRGIYIISVMASWMYKGDVSYIFSLDVV